MKVSWIEKKAATTTATLRDIVKAMRDERRKGEREKKGKRKKKSGLAAVSYSNKWVLRSKAFSQLKMLDAHKSNPKDVKPPANQETPQR